MTDTPEKPALDPSAYNVLLPEVEFEGPLDLLLHLIQKHELNILDIPMRFITEKYLEYLSLLRLFTIDNASEYLVMAAMLTHIKSKMLLPQAPPNQEDGLVEEESDPREELVRRLLEYQKYKHAAAELQDRGTLGQDVFTRPATPEDAPKNKEDGPLQEFPVYALFDAFSKLLERRKLKVDHQVTFDRLTISDRMNQLTDLLQTKRRVVFEEMFEGVANRFDLVITFLALLEMTKLRLTRLFQTDPTAPLYVEYVLAGDVEGEGPLPPATSAADLRPPPAAPEDALAEGEEDEDEEDDEDEDEEDDEDEDEEDDEDEDEDEEDDEDDDDEEDDEDEDDGEEVASEPVADEDAGLSAVSEEVRELDASSDETHGDDDALVEGPSEWSSTSGEGGEPDETQPSIAAETPPVVEESPPVVEEDPVVEQTPIVEETPPVADDAPSLEQTHTADPRVDDAEKTDSGSKT